MKKSLKTNLILAFVLIAFSAFAYWYEFKKQPELEAKKEQNEKLIAVQESWEWEELSFVNEAKEVNVQITCKENCRLSNPRAIWEIKKPILFRADDGNVSSFIAGVTSAKIENTVELKGDVEKNLVGFGLGSVKRQQHKITLKVKSFDKPFEVFLGDKSAIGDNIYAYVVGPNLKSKLVLIPSHAQEKANRNLSFWRDKRIFHFAASEVEKVELRNSKGSTELALQGSDWFLKGKLLAANETVNTFLTGLIHMHAKEYVSDSKKKDFKKLKINSSPRYQLLVTLKNKSKVHFKIYESGMKNAPKVYATLEDQSFIIEVDRTNLEKFRKNKDDFRFKRILTASDKENLKKVRVLFDHKTRLSLAKGTGKGWTLESGSIPEFESSRFDQGVSTIGSLKIAKFVEHKKVPSGTKLQSEWSFLGDTDKLIRGVSLYEFAKNQDFYVKFNNGEWALLEKGVAKSAPKSLKYFSKNFEKNSGAKANVKVNAPAQSKDPHAGHNH